MKPKPCKICASIYHQAFQCKENPNVVAKQKATMERMIEKQKAKQLIKKVPVKKKKLTMRDVNAKIKSGSNLTVAEKKIQYSNQKEKAWRAFSNFIRAEGCLDTTGTLEHGICTTCEVAGRPSEFPYAKLQSGHSVGGRRDSVLFHEDIVWIQCMNCNRQGAGGLSGDYGNFMTFLTRKFGLEYAESLQRLKMAYVKSYTYHDLIDVESEYKKKLSDLLENKDKRQKLL